MKKLLFGLLLGFYCFGAEQISTWGRTYTCYCGYFTHGAGEFDVTFQNKDLPWGTKVWLIAGWGGTRFQDARFDWRYRNEIEMSAVAPFTWQAKVQKTLHERTSSESLDRFQFVFKVEVPQRPPYWVNGGSSTWGYFEVRSELYLGPCIRNDDDKPKLRGYDVYVIKK